MSKKVIYTAGPYRDPRGEWFVKQNILQAEEAAMDVWIMGGIALCPHMNTAFFGGACDDNVWLEGDLELLRRCDAIYVFSDETAGVVAEIDEANRQGIPVLWSHNEIRDFLRE